MLKHYFTDHVAKCFWQPVFYVISVISQCFIKG